MLVTKPSYYDSFRCLADACPDSCCREWAVEVDPESADRYRALPGPLGDRLRQVLHTEDGETVMTIEDGRCPMWRGDGLCRIQAELGEQALCRVCREFPRLRHDYGDFQELGLELSCPEAARLILSTPAEALISMELPGGEPADYDDDAMAVLKSSRKTMLAILSDTGRPVGETLALGLLYGCHAQAELDGGEVRPFDPDSALDTAGQFARPGDIREFLDFFLGLEILTPQWHARLTQAHVPVQLPESCRALARYLVERYWLQAVSDYDLYGRVKLLVSACLLVSFLEGDFAATAQLFSKEIENDADNVDTILDAAYSHPAFADEKLLGWTLRARPAANA